MEVKRLDSGYWFVSFNMNQFIQWPVGHSPRFEDGFPASGIFGAPTLRQFMDAEQAVREYEMEVKLFEIRDEPLPRGKDQ
mgnify:CR=1 FL=1